MTVDKLKATYDDVKRRRQNYRIYNILGIAVMVAGLFGPLFVSVYLIGQFIPLTGAFYAISAIFCSICGLYLTFKALSILMEKMLPCETSLGERTLLEVYPAVHDLDMYLNRKIEAFRISASKKISKAIKKMIDEWSYGEFNLIKREVGEDLTKIKENLDDKLLTTIKSGEEKDLHDGMKILTDFCNYLIDPTLTGLKQLNVSMANLKGFPKTKELSVTERILRPRPTRLAVSLLLGFGIMYFVFYYASLAFGTTALSFIHDNFGAFVGASVALTGIIMLAFSRK